MGRGESEAWISGSNCMLAVYDLPERRKTTIRCKFSLPGKYYDCRRLGVYVLGAQGYCLPHYDVAWKVANPEQGPQHDFSRTMKFQDKDIPICVKCGSIKVHDGLPQCLCKGFHSKIVLR